MNKILVTGGCGFIGSHFIRYAMSHFPSCSIVNLDKLTYSGNAQNLRDIASSRRYQFVKGDINDRILVETAAKGVDAIINFAAETHVDRSIDDGEVFIRTNVSGVHALLEVTKSLQIPVLLHVSTDEVYGSIARGAAREDCRLNPSNPYSASKAAADLLIMSYWNTYRIPVRIVRPTNNYGPHQYPEKVIPLFVTNLIENKPLPLYGSGKNTRNWLNVQDTCCAISLVLEKGQNGEVYNVSGNSEIENIGLAKKLLSMFDKKSDAIQTVEDRPGHDLRYSVNDKKIQKLGFKPQVQFEDGLKETVEWYKKNETWWKPLKLDKYTVKLG